MSEIRVDIDELLEKITSMKEDDYATALLEISSDNYCSELLLSAVSFESEDPISYGSIPETDDEL